jgi:hypothetical protein
MLLAPRRGTGGPEFTVAGCTLSPRRFLLGDRTYGRPADLATGGVVMPSLGVLQPFLLSGRPGVTCIILVVLALTGLAIERLRNLRLRRRTSNSVAHFWSRGRSNWGRL